MPSLKDLKNRIESVKSTRKITSAMKMVAASKLRRAQDNVIAARPYGAHLNEMMDVLLENSEISEAAAKLLKGSGKVDTVLLVVVVSARGLCGAFNSSVLRETRRQIKTLEDEGKKVKIACVGRKSRDLLRREHSDKFIYVLEDIAVRNLPFYEAENLRDKMINLFEDDEIDVVRVIFNKFQSAIAQIVTTKQILPLEGSLDDIKASEQSKPKTKIDFEIFEPSHKILLERILPLNIAVQLYDVFLESAASEHGARMTSMDNATRNAGDMIDDLTLVYNRSRQAQITKELIEIISGAEAV